MIRIRKEVLEAERTMIHAWDYLDKQRDWTLACRLLEQDVNLVDAITLLIDTYTKIREV